MRLIDADAEIAKLKDEIEHEKKTIKIYRGSEDTYDKYICNSAKGKISFLQQKIDFLRKCRTAYDVDKVVERLENEKNSYFEYGRSGLYEAIDIVKAGGAHE